MASSAKVTVALRASKLERVNSAGPEFEVSVSAREAKALVESGYGRLVKTAARGKEKAVKE